MKKLKTILSFSKEKQLDKKRKVIEVSYYLVVILQ